MTQHLVRASILRGFEEFLETRGLALAPLLDELDLPLPKDGDFERNLPFERVAQLMDRAADACGDPDFALSYASAYPVGGTGLLGFLFMNSPNIEDALSTLVRFIPMLRSPMKYSFRTTSGGGTVAWHPTNDALRVHQQIYNFGVAVLTLRLRSMLGADWQPQRIDLLTRRPDNTKMTSEFFGPNVRYAQASNAIWLDRASLNHPVAQAMPALRSVLERYGRQEMADLSTPEDSLVENTRKTILHLMGERRLSLEEIAAHMKYTPRTLQAHLAAAATTFEDVLNDARKLRAEELMKRQNITLTQIAYHLGFSELSAFTRAAQRWFGRSPSAQRQLLK